MKGSAIIAARMRSQASARCGGTPIAADRILGTNFGYYALETLMRGGVGRMVVRVNNVFTDVDLLHAAGKQRLVPPDHPLIAAARGIGTSFGDHVNGRMHAETPAVVV